MKTLVTRCAAKHGALWSIDAWYRRAWYVWPQMAAVLVASLIFPGTPASNTPGSWARPAQETSPGPTPGPQPQPQPQTGDMAVCRGTDPAQAVPACTRIIAEGKATGDALADVYMARGYAHGRRSAFDQALADYNEAIRLKPNHLFALNNRGSELLRRNQIDQALVDLNQAIGMNPTSALPFHNRGDAYFRKGQYDRAVADLNEAVKRDANLAQSYFLRGRAFLGTNCCTAATSRRTFTMPPPSSSRWRPRRCSSRSSSRSTSPR
jgi:tetratricopeptide (TPR) repeat protein